MNKTHGNARTQNEIMQNEDLDEITKQAIGEYYNKVASNEIIEECDFSFNVDTIRTYIQDYIANTNEHPTIIIDYLQILAPSNPKFTDKQQVDYNITSLKKISRDFKIPIIAISSFNRMNYTQTASFEAFKESGGIEYTADVLLTMQLKILSENDVITNEQIREAKRQVPREIQLICLKNRNGKSNFSINFNFNPIYNSFSEQPLEQQDNY